MSWLITGTEKTPVDQFGIQNVSLLLHADGTNGSTTFTDSSPSPKSVTRNGDTVISTAQSKFGGSSIAFDGTGDWLNIPTISFNRQYTLEAFIYPTQIPQYPTFEYGTAGVLGGRDVNGPSFRFRSDNTLEYVALQPSLIIVSSTLTASLNTWTHIAVTRDAQDQVKIFVGGQASGTGTMTGVHSFSKVGQTGFGAAERFVNGYIDEVRFSSVVRYTANFTPPTAPFPDI